VKAVAQGDRVWAHYREHSIPTRSPGVVIETYTMLRTALVKLDHPHTVESGNVIRVPWAACDPRV
jgi:hypothetical protein